MGRYNLGWPCSDLALCAVDVEITEWADEPIVVSDLMELWLDGFYDTNPLGAWFGHVYVKRSLFQWCNECSALCSLLDVVVKLLVEGMVQGEAVIESGGWISRWARTFSFAKVGKTCIVHYLHWSIDKNTGKDGKTFMLLFLWYLRTRE